MSPPHFRAVWFVDLEFHQPDGETPTPICMVATEMHSGVTMRLTSVDLMSLDQCPFAIGDDALVVAYYASAEMNCFLALGWGLPANVLDLYIEFSNQTNGQTRVAGRGLLGALVHYGLSGIAYTEKQAMRDLAMRGGPYNSTELDSLLTYCESDVNATRALYVKMIGDIDLPRAILRGRYTKAVARMEAIGVPIDLVLWNQLTSKWEDVRTKLVDALNTDYLVGSPDDNRRVGLFEETTFKRDRFIRFLKEQNISWPMLESGVPELSDDTFRKMAKIHTIISPLRELRHTLTELRVMDLSVGNDGRNRCMLSPFASKTGRNQPSTSRFIFGASVWLRGLIKPEPGYGLAYIDWSGQEYGIAAALSGDRSMMDDYQCGDPYLAFAKRLGAVPQEATKQSHAGTRDAFKVALGLGAMYGAGAKTVSQMIGETQAYADYLLREHRVRYPRFWEWREAVVTHAMLHGRLQTVFGWNIFTGMDVNQRSLSNFPMQANGAEMMRLACCLATEAGVRVCCPVHDALLIEAPLDQFTEMIRRTRDYMAEASRIVLDGFELRTGVEKVSYPGRYRDEARGGLMWDRVMGILETL